MIFHLPRPSHSFPQICPTSTEGGRNAFLTCTFDSFGKKILGMALEILTKLSLNVTTYGVLALYFTYGSPLLIEIFFQWRKTPNFAKFHQSFINSYYFLENKFSCKITQKILLLQVFTLSLDKVTFFLLSTWCDKTLFHFICYQQSTERIDCCLKNQKGTSHWKKRSSHCELFLKKRCSSILLM